MNVLRILRRTTATFPRLGAIRQMSGKVENTTVEPEIPGFREPGQIATNFDVATGNERYEYLAELEGKDPWEDLHPIYLTSKPTIANPVVIKGVDPVRYIGCTGYPADSHEAIWLTVLPEINNRCPHCGNVFKYEIEHEEHH